MSVFRIILAVIVVLLAADLIVAKALVRVALTRNGAQARDPQPDSSPAWQEYYRRAVDGKAWIAAQPTEKCEIRSFDGLKLRATLLPAAQPTARTILCIHGYRANGRFDFGAIAPFLHGLGWNVLLPDDRAHGESEGTYIGFGNLDSQDCLAWCRWLTERYGGDCTLVLYGISMGAAAVLAASGDEALPPQVRGIVADCGFSSGWEEVRLQIRNMFHLPSFPLLPTADLLLRLHAGYSLRERAAVERVKSARVPLLIIHGKADAFVPAAMGEEIYRAAAAPDKRLLLVDGAVHAHSYLTDSAAYEAAFRELTDKAAASAAVAT